MNFIEKDDMIENLTTLFADDHDRDVEDIIFPNEEEVMDILREERTDSAATEATSSSSFQLQQPLAIVWDDEAGERYWCVAFYLGISDMEDQIIVDCLQIAKKSKEKASWARPASDDIQHINPQWIIPVDINGDWNFEARQPLFKITNANNVEDLFQQLFA